MLVYGDVKRQVTIEAQRRLIEGKLGMAARLDRGLERHAALVSAFIGASELVQSMIDAEFHRRGCDAPSRVHECGMRYLTGLAGCIRQSWHGGADERLPPSSLLDEICGSHGARLLSIKEAEGYAFYALYPEAVLEAARRSGLGPRTRVIGIRSIGAGLSALVAAALEAPLPITVRPVGHPFQRELCIDPALAQSLVSDAVEAYAIVDEGPGLSGSSFGAVADWLEAHGVSPDRIHFFPSHSGDLGPQASEHHRERWRKAARHVVPTDDVLLQPSRGFLSALEAMIGPLEAPLDDISGGAWRTLRLPDERDWPAANLQQERRKFLARTRTGTWLVKFAGLGAAGEQKLETAMTLHQGGHMARPLGYCHGFIVEPWRHRALTLQHAPLRREELVKQVGRYLAFRANHLPSTGSGASLDELAEMACHNAEQALGSSASTILRHALSPSPGIEAKVRRVRTDNRMHAWEWLVEDGRLVKTDALDHSATHDLIGQQDIAWDVAGAVVELDLSDEEKRSLCEILREATGRPIDLELFALLNLCYLAFQMGAFTMAARTHGGQSEAHRLQSMAERYAARLRREMGCVAEHPVSVLP